MRFLKVKVLLGPTVRRCALRPDSAAGASARAATRHSGQVMSSGWPARAKPAVWAVISRPHRVRAVLCSRHSPSRGSAGTGMSLVPCSSLRVASVIMSKEFVEFVPAMLPITSIAWNRRSFSSVVRRQACSGLKSGCLSPVQAEPVPATQQRQPGRPVRSAATEPPHSCRSVPG